MSAAASDSETARPASGPLLGVRVIDLTATLMGPYCTQLLADMGADVIKVEPPQGDTTRYLQQGHRPGMSEMFTNLARGKRSIVLDLKQPEALAVLERLLAGADVCLHSMRHRAVERLGLAYERVRQLRPDIIYANLYGYGRSGPYADWPAYDDTIQGIAGLARLQERVVGEPRYVPTVMADKIAGMTAAYAIAMALFHRQRTGEGQELEIAMFETMVSFLMVEHIGGALYDPPQGETLYQRAIAPHRRPYATLDGYLSVLIYNDRQWQRFVALAGHPPALCDPRFADLASRSRHVDEMYQHLAEVLATRSTADWLEALQQAGIPAVPLRSLQELTEDPHLLQTGFFQSQQTKEGRLRFPGIPTRFSRTPGRIREAAPRLGEHTRAVLAEAGCSAEQIDQLLRNGGAAEALDSD
ncbi:MAG: CoA transferase [Xanthomonadales bacterium]|nr:CoA transferase [Xanthomonadales bacterium]